MHQLDAARSAVRRALAALEREGLVVRHVGRGTFLADSVDGLTTNTLADSSPAEIMQARLLLEPHVALLAARAATRAALDRITHCLHHGESSIEADYEGFESWDGALHRAIARAAHNGLLLTMFDAMDAEFRLPVWGGLRRRSSTPERRRCYHADRIAIVQALRDRDPDGARERTRIDLGRVSDNLLGGH